MSNNCVILSKRYDAFLALSNGKRFYGYSVGYEGFVSAELCFTTAMTGYQHVVTDPSYNKQMIVFSAAHIGNVGINDFDYESLDRSVLASGIIMPNMLVVTNHPQSNEKMKDWLKKNRVVAIAGVDTRELVKYIKDFEVQKAILFCGEKVINDSNVQNTIDQLCANVGENLESQDLITIRSVPPYVDTKIFKCSNTRVENPDTVLLVDFGVKNGIVRCLQEYFDVHIKDGTQIGWSDDIDTFSGVVLSNGPGDPKLVYDNMKEDFLKLFLSNIPIFGICLGHQIIGLQFGGKTKKMFTGHRSITHPVYNIESQKILISSQNHGFVVDIDTDNNNTVNSNIQVIYRSLVDDSIEGIRIRDSEIFSVQFHPEASAGTGDALFVFEEFFDVVTNHKY